MPRNCRIFLIFASDTHTLNHSHTKDMEETSTTVKPMVLDYEEICRMAPFFKGRKKLVDRLFHLLSIDKVNDIHARNCDTPGVEFTTRLLRELDIKLRIDGEESESQMFTIQQNLDTAREELQTAEKNLANCKAVAPIDGMVIGLTIQPGDEIPANTTVVTVSDTSTVVISANVDERNISYIKPGMSVELDQWGTPAFGTVETVSLSSTVNNGVATYPITMSADNAEGTLQVNRYVNYTITASENDNCLVLPLQCVRTVSQEDGTTVNVVFVESGQRPENAIDTPSLTEEIPDGFWAVPVEIGISDNFNVEIKSGVEEGTVVFTQIQSLNGW